MVNGKLITKMIRTFQIVDKYEKVPAQYRMHSICFVNER